MTQTHLTIGQLARQENAPVWKVRRIVDSLRRDLPRAGQYRLVPLGLLPEIRERLSDQTMAAKKAAALVEELRGRGLNVVTGDKLEAAR